MKKLLYVLMIIACAGSAMVMTGCLGDGDGGSVLSTGTSAGVVLVSLTASGPASAAAFAVNEKLDSSVRAAAVASTKYIVRITPSGKTPVEFTQVNVDSRDISITGASVQAGTNGQMLIEILPVGYTAATAPLFKFYTVQAVDSGKTVSKTYKISPADTAKAMLYEAWTSSATYSIDWFQPSAAQITAVETEIINTMNAQGSTYGNTYAVSAATRTAVTNNVPPAISTDQTAIKTGIISLSLTSINGTNFISNDTVAPPTEEFLSVVEVQSQQHLGQYYYADLDSANKTRFVYHVANATSLTGVTEATAWDDNAGTIYKHHTYAAMATPRELRVNDVFVVHIRSNNTFGAFRVMEVQNGQIIIAYKFNPQSGNRNLNSTFNG